MLQRLQAQETIATHVLGETYLFLLCALSPLFDFVETAILHEMYLCCTHICQEAELSLSKKAFKKKTCHKAQDGHKSCFSAAYEVSFAKQTLP